MNVQEIANIAGWADHAARQDERSRAAWAAFANATDAQRDQFIAEHEARQAKK